MTLDELLAECSKDPPTIAAALPSPAVDEWTLPHWVVVVNPARNPPRPKAVRAYATKEESDAERQRRESAESERVEDVYEADVARVQELVKAGKPYSEAVKQQPMRFFVIDRPAGGQLR